ncbi:bifunctional tetrahydrofolate synthase/dihydrofolate synthase [Vibrio sp. S11_S32]|uniref:bifunctional tetrahydrofolate synthase/dihydrofolate synthase n=1 Tax=Vibrio sp. S11_S32 TaxID=2720225 RepID=UPI00168184F7|nr:bifunctional tetrahydrofolate synthase/dihydrofolate synthase [Vibrio sp. S11_S32]MBD1574938.1 bifunctional tetrahydrofolate synthase/dihydrofolate synthase [Vibrio sp. S11_S32]
MSKHLPPKATSPLSMWLCYLESIHTSAIDLGLERVSKVAVSANLTKPASTVITVAGTNGKGSTCALMEAILLDAGYNVGVYSSPHLIEYNERVRINGQNASDEQHTQAFDFIEQARLQTSLSVFEFGTLAALRIFQQQQVDVVLLEVGLGGRLDATNVVDHDVSIITSLAIDHVDWLGDDINVIGYEKAGIFRSGKPAICGQPQAPATVAAHADDIGAQLHQVGYQFNYQRDSNNSARWHWNCGAFDLSDLPVPSLPLANAATALMALSTSGLDITDVNIVKGLEKAQLAGRMQILSSQPTILLDVAHNPHSAQYLVQQLQLNYLTDANPERKIHAVVGMLHDKDINATLQQLMPVVDYWYPASLQGPRAASAQQLCLSLPEDVIQYATPIEAFNYAQEQLKAEDVLLVVGSFHTVGEVLSHWQSDNKRSLHGE